MKTSNAINYSVLGGSIVTVIVWVAEQFYNIKIPLGSVQSALQTIISTAIIGLAALVEMLLIKAKLEPPQPPDDKS